MTEKIRERPTGPPSGDAKGRVLDAIRARGVSMRPRWYFVLQGVLAALGFAIIFLGGLYLASFVVFLLRHTGAWFVPAFGPRGWLVLLLSLPWVLVVLIALFIVLLEVLVRRYSFAWRRPLLQSMAALVTLVVAGGVVVGLTPLHGRLSQFVEDRDVPFVEPIYRAFEGWHRDDVHRGTVRTMSEAGFIFEEYDGDVLKVDLAGAAVLDGSIAPGDTVVVFGPEDDGRIEARGVRTLLPSDVE